MEAESQMQVTASWGDWAAYIARHEADLKALADVANQVRTGQIGLFKGMLIAYPIMARLLSDLPFIAPSASAEQLLSALEASQASAEAGAAVGDEVKANWSNLVSILKEVLPLILQFLAK